MCVAAALQTSRTDSTVCVIKLDPCCRISLDYHGDHERHLEFYIVKVDCSANRSSPMASPRSPTRQIACVPARLPS